MTTDRVTVLKRHVVTEKTTSMKATGNQIVFEVDRGADKEEIRKAVEETYKVKVAAVNTMIVRGKIKKMGRYSGYRSNWKKAVVTLPEGTKIDSLEGTV